MMGIVRAHQCKEEVGGVTTPTKYYYDPSLCVCVCVQGVSYSYTDNREVIFPFPYVTTVFSASNYCGSYGNKGAVMIFYPEDIQVIMCV